MSEKKKINEEQLKTVTGGRSNSVGYYFVIQYINQDGYNRSTIKGPFETETIAREKSEEEKNKLIENGCTIKNIQIVFKEYAINDQLHPDNVAL